MKSLQIFLLLTLSTLYVSEGARCNESIGGLSCSPCSKGARCLGCNWCTGFCFNGQKRDTEGTEYGSVEASYKDPYLDLFNELEALLSDDRISERDVVELYKNISDATREDCENCDNSPELNDLSIFAAMVSGLLDRLVGIIFFKWEAMIKTVMAKTMVQNLPDSLTIKVDPESSIPFLK